MAPFCNHHTHLTYSFHPPFPNPNPHLTSSQIRFSVLSRAHFPYRKRLSTDTVHQQRHGKRKGYIFAQNFNEFARDGGTTETSQPPLSSDTDTFRSRKGNVEDGYVGLFIRMLGMDNDPLDREQAINALWRYSQGGKESIDEIVKFPGCVNLTIILLKSDHGSVSEAAAGLLRTISSVNIYRASVAEAGAIEEINGLLSRPNLPGEVKEQCVCTLWNLSVDEKIRVKMAKVDFLLPKLVRFLGDEDIKVREAAGGVLANLALSPSSHEIMVEAGVIPKLAEILKNKEEESKTIKKEARNVLLELANDEYYRILIVEEGFVLVPIVGADAYKSFSSPSHSWPTLPDGTEIKRDPSTPSKYGAGELLLGLNIKDKNINLEEGKVDAIVGRSQQQFLARIGAIEMEEGIKLDPGAAPHPRFTLLPWRDGVARLVLILGLEDVSVIEKAAHSIAVSCINEHIRLLFKEAGAIKRLVCLLAHDNDAVRFASAHALDRLSISYNVSRIIESHGVVDPLLDILKDVNTSQSLIEKAMSILSWISNPDEEMMNTIQGSLDQSSEFIAGLEGALSEPSELKETTTREKILKSGVIPHIIETMKSSTPALQQKAACILENIAINEHYATAITGEGVASGLEHCFRLKCKDENEENEVIQRELDAIEAEEVGLAVSAASRLLTRLLAFEECCQAIDSTHFFHILCRVLKSNIPLRAKDWVAACLIKLETLAGPSGNLDCPIDMEVTLHETIPRLVEEMRSSFSSELQEAAVVELNQIISRGVADYARQVAARGGIFPLVKLIDQGSERARNAGLAILYNLSMDSENHAAIMAAGSVPVLRRIVLSERPQWTRALHLLQTLPT
ncbi:uncharacterized protein LOC18428760 [Amborella trichopoda]|uniref:Armadillo repeat-containing domain-containing protein n=1 Tax=Amborella trichopoda TaxID=13333 RepID=W1NTE3_AMBTC|nr:uncharacterized protein LOC18428760 [Amborella trichopoda]ERN00692.1 hypothetical protein AMTR_s00106p00063870 [Amborella trichopoda]|eukprot:XP_006838123.1 uncharacterized protein LOC18428760 [Amborella trichopoda]